MFLEVAVKLWNCYRATNKKSFSQRVRRLAEWYDASQSLPAVISEPIKKHRKIIGSMLPPMIIRVAIVPAICLIDWCNAWIGIFLAPNTFMGLWGRQNLTSGAGLLFAIFRHQIQWRQKSITVKKVQPTGLMASHIMRIGYKIYWFPLHSGNFDRLHNPV